MMPNLQRLHRLSLGMNEQFHPTLCNGWNYLSILGLNLINVSTWWRHEMEAFSALLALCEGKPHITWIHLTKASDVFIDLLLNKWLSKYSRRRWYETQSCSLWRHCNEKGLDRTQQQRQLKERQQESNNRKSLRRVERVNVYAQVLATPVQLRIDKQWPGSTGRLAFGFHDDEISWKPFLHCYNICSDVTWASCRLK